MKNTEEELKMMQDEIEKDMPWFHREFLAKVQI